MNTQHKFFLLFALLFFGVSVCPGATITGTVKGPDGASFMGAFVQVRSTKLSKMTYMGLSDAQGRYQVEKIPAGEYQIQVRAVGYSFSPKTGINFTGDQSMSVDIPLQKGEVHWNDLSVAQYDKLWPAGEGKKILFEHCIICHNWQTRIASFRRDEDGWRDRVEYMRKISYFSLGSNFTDKDAAAVASYLAKLFGPDSVLPKSPAEMPAYAATVHSYPADVMNIKYVEYDMPGPSRMPFSATPVKDGMVWIPNFGIANKITRLNPITGEMKDYDAPNDSTDPKNQSDAIHSVYGGPDGRVWFAEQGTNKLGMWDPKTDKITQYQDERRPDAEPEHGGAKHTTRVDPDGYVWTTGFPLSRFDPKTGKFTDYWDDAAHTYGIEPPDKNGAMWFTEFDKGLIGAINYKTQKFTYFKPPTKDRERRLAEDSKGVVWFGEYNSGHIGSFDPKTEQFKEYLTPDGAVTHPYAVVVDANDNIWYSGLYMDRIGCLDPKTGKFTEYPFPHSENNLKEFFRDDQGRIWYGTAPNNKVGYFYVNGLTGSK
jgi:virginiamycin B lyase